MKRKTFVLLLIMGLVVATASAQFGGVVYDPTNYQNALLRYFQLQQHLIQLQQTYTKVLSHYNLALQMAREDRHRVRVIVDHHYLGQPG